MFPLVSWGSRKENGVQKELDDTMRRRGAVVCLLLLFCISRMLLFRFMPMRWENVQVLMQIPDLEALRADLWGTLWNLHAQPPLFNLLVGCVAHSFSESTAGWVYQGLFSLLGLLSMFCIYGLADRFSKSSVLAAWTAAAYCLFPTCLLYERSVSYALPVMALLIFAAWAFSKAGKSLGYVAAGVFFAALVVLTRSFYHWGMWLIPVVVWGYVAARRLYPKQMRPEVLLGIILVVSTAAIPYWLNYHRYGMFTGSTWQGLNLSRTIVGLPPSVRRTLVENGSVTGLIRIVPFSSPQVYLDYYRAAGVPESVLQSRGVRVLDNVFKSGADGRTGRFNFNHFIIPYASRESERNFWSIVRNNPEVYGAAVVNSIYNFFGVEAYRFLPERGEIISWRLFCQNFAVRVGFLALFLSACIAFGRELFAGHPELRLVSGFIVFTLIYVLGVSVCFESGESCVMRVPIDPFALLGTALLVGRLMGWRSRNHAGVR